jgi:lipoyl(octanoyl) transferase
MCCVIRTLGRVDYATAWQNMLEFTQMRGATTQDEIWFLEHEPVFTLGRAGKPEHVLDSGDIPLIRSDRGGQVTYHGPGQLMMYVLLDLSRLGVGVKQLVSVLEQSVIAVLHIWGVAAHTVEGAPGVYVNQEKIAALGLRIIRGRSLHGVSVNIDMDVSPFTNINPCGYPGLAVTDLSTLVGERVCLDTVANQMGLEFIKRLRKSA